jgi:hypothetical protein
LYSFWRQKEEEGRGERSMKKEKGGKMFWKELIRLLSSR